MLSKTYQQYIASIAVFIRYWKYTCSRVSLVHLRSMTYGGNTFHVWGLELFRLNAWLVLI